MLSPSRILTSHKGLAEASSSKYHWMTKIFCLQLSVLKCQMYCWNFGHHWYVLKSTDFCGGCLGSTVTGILTNQIVILFFFPFPFFLKGVVGQKKLVLAASPCAHVTLDKLCRCLLCLFSLKWFRCPEIRPT